MTAARTEGEHVRVVPREARAFQGEAVGVVSRLIAGAVDVAVAALALGAGYVGWAAFLFVWKGRRFEAPTISFGAAFLLGVLILIVLLARGWSLTGRSIGDRFMGLRVVTARGAPLGGGRAILRAVISVAFPLLLLWCAIDRRRRSVADLVLRTRVIYDWETRSARE